MTKNEPVTKSEAASRWGVSATMVTKYTKSGMPVLADGRLDWQAADHWRRQNVVSARSGNYHARRRASAVAADSTVLAAQVKLIGELSSPAAMAATVRVARRIGLTLEQTYAMASWAQIAPALYTSVPDECFDGLEPDWGALLPGLEIQAADELFESAAADETTPRSFRA